MPRRLIIVGVVALLCVAAGLLVLRQLGPRTSVHFVVPTGFRGYFKIIEDPANGQPVAGTKGHYRFVIPTDGVLRLQSMVPFRRLRTVSATFSDGTVLQAQDSFVATDKTIVLGNKTVYYSSGDVWFCVGPRSELQRKFELREGADEVGVGRVIDRPPE